ncbi:MAG: conjugative transposon protein TraM [Bacteroidota bacterium]|nr:conjugative transposon protein TraM [Bacteroidota bacterium]
MKPITLTPKMARQRKLMLFLPLIVLPFLTLFFWAMGTGKASPVNTGSGKGFNSRLPDAKLKDNSALNKMSYYDRAELDSNKLRQEMKSDPYYKQRGGTDTAGLHFPAGNAALAGTQNGLHLRAALAGTGSDPASENAAKVYQKLAALQTAINKPAVQAGSPAGFSIADPVPAKKVSQQQSQPATEDPELQQMNGLLEKILDIQHPERLKPQPNNKPDTSAKRFRAIPAVIDGNQKVTQGTVVRIRLLDTITINGQLIPKGQLIYASGSLYNQRMAINIRLIHIGYEIIPANLTVYDMIDGLEGISVPEAVTGDAVKDGADEGLRSMELMSMDESMGAQAATAGINAAKGLFSKKIKRVKGKLKGGHPLLLRVNKKL